MRPREPEIQREREMHKYWLEASLRCGPRSERAVLPSGSEPRLFSRDWESKRDTNRLIKMFNVYKSVWRTRMTGTDDGRLICGRPRETEMHIYLLESSLWCDSRSERADLAARSESSSWSFSWDCKSKRDKNRLINTPKCINLSYGPVWTSTRCNRRYTG